MKANFCALRERGVLRLSGRDVRTFLQALVTRDLDYLTTAQTVYSALLTPQGKYLFDFFLAQHDTDILLDGEAARLDALMKRLNMYKLRADVVITKEDGWEISAVYNGNIGMEPKAGAAWPFGAGVAFTDPRVLDAGARIMAPVGQASKMLSDAGFVAGDKSDYEYFRLGLALPESGRHLVTDKSLMLESNLDSLNGVDFDKGCFVGQELTARTKYRALVRKRLLPVDVQGPMPEPNEPLMSGQSEIASMRSGQGDRGLALVRLDRLVEAGGLGITLTAGSARLTPMLPSWANFEIRTGGT